MIPNHYIKNSCFTKHPLKDSCWGYQVHMYMYVSQSTQCSMWYSYTILYYTILYYTILYYTILYYTILSYPILSYPILSYPILYYTIPYHTILYCYISTVVGFQTHLNNIHQMLIVSSIIRVKNSTKKKKTWGFVARASHDWKTSCKVHFHQRFYSQKPAIQLPKKRVVSYLFPGEPHN